MPGQQNQNVIYGSFVKIIGLYLLWKLLTNSAIKHQISNFEGNALSLLDFEGLKNPQFIENQEACVKTPIEISLGQKGFVFPDEVGRIYNSTLPVDEALKTEKTFGGSAMHLNIMNHFYEAALAILEKFPKAREELLDQPDKNGRTPLHLALEIGAPESVITKLLTEKNILMADKDGITPFMLSARGLSREGMAKILETIPKDQFQEAIDQKDDKGRTVIEWNKMPKEEMIERFHGFEMDGTRDAEYCTSSLFFSDVYPFLASPTFSNKAKATFRSVGLESGTSYFAGQEYVGIKATKENVQKLISYANEDSIETNKARKELSDFWFKSSNADSAFWRYIGEQTTKIGPNLSGISLVDRYAENQKTTLELLQTCQPKQNSCIEIREAEQLKPTEEKNQGRT